MLMAATKKWIWNGTDDSPHPTRCCGSRMSTRSISLSYLQCCWNLSTFVAIEHIEASKPLLALLMIIAAQKRVPVWFQRNREDGAQSYLMHLKGIVTQEIEDDVRSLLSKRICLSSYQVFKHAYRGPSTY